MMPAMFQADGIRFQYPDNWKLSREETESGWTAFVQSPETAFFLLTYDREAPDVGVLAQTALQALQEEYPGLEADDALESLAGQPAFGHNIRFFSLDLTNTCCTRCFDCATGTVLMMWQANDLELDAIEPVFRAMCASLKLEEE